MNARRIAFARAAAYLFLAQLAGCEGGDGDGDDPLSFSFELDPAVPPGEEDYACFAFNAAWLADRAVQGVAWEPGSGPATLHHATLFAVSGEVAPAKSPCGVRAERSIVLHVWTPGSSALALPDGVALALPSWVTGLLVEAHALRLAEGPSLPSQVTLIPAPDGPLQLAAWVDDRAPVPVIAPHSEVASSRTCVFEQAANVVSTWPHMHRIGKEFHGTVVRKDGGREPLIEVAPWDFNHQLSYPVSAALAPGDGVETACAWQNASQYYVHPGLKSADEMCNQGLIVWPVAAARCAP